MRRRALMIGLLAVLAACRAAPPQPTFAERAPVPTPAVQAGRPAPAAPAATPPPTPVPQRPIPAGATRVRVDATRISHAASPYVNGYNRNHTHRQFAVHDMDRAATMAALRRLVPTWGQAYLDELIAAGYPAKPSARALYRTGHGPTDGRADYAYLPGYLFQRFWDLDGVPEIWDGYAYDDFRFAVREAEEAGAEPLVTVNFGSDTAESAGTLARWLNAPADPLRGERPFHRTDYRTDVAAPRGAFLFEIGNEIALPVAVGHDKANTVEEYVANAKAYVEAVRAASPHPVKVALAAAVNVYWGGPWSAEDAWPQRDALVRAFIAAARREGLAFDALQYHGYPLYPVRERLAGNAYAERLIRERLLPALAEADWPIEIWNDEFHSASVLPRNTGLYGALYAADSVVTAFALSHRGKQLIPVTTDFAVWHAGRGNGYDSLYFQQNRPDKVTPIYQLRRLLATRWGDWIVHSETSGGGGWQDEGLNGERTEVSNLHAVAARARDGTLWLLVVNRGRVDEQAWLELPGFAPAGATRSMIAAAPEVADPWEAAWNQVVVREDEPLALDAPVVFPRGSISLVGVRPTSP